MFIKIQILFLIFSIYGGQTFPQQRMSVCHSPIEYEDSNQSSPNVLSVNVIAGSIIDPGGADVPNVCMGLFTEDDHRLVAETTSDKKGRFGFKDIPNGRYRLVAKYSVFCTANVPIQLIREAPRKGKRKQIVIHMDAGMHGCSYGDYK